MPHAIIRGENGRRHEVDFGDAPVRVEIYHSDETVEIFIEADFETIPEERRRSALLNIPRHLFSEAIARGGATVREPPSLRHRPDKRFRHQDSAASALLSPTPTSFSKQAPPPSPKIDHGIDGTIRRTVALQEARRSQRLKRGLSVAIAEW
jgi:hypothetical protein